MNKNAFVALIVIAVIAIGGYVFPQGNTVVERVVEKLGTAVGPEYSNTQYFNGGLTEAGGCFATTTTGTLTAGMFEKNGCIKISAAGAGQAALSLTLPASTTMQSVLPQVGSCRTWWVDASAVAAATTTTFVAGTGVDVVGLDATGQGTGSDVIDGLEFGVLKMCRQSDSDVTAFIQEYIAAD